MFDFDWKVYSALAFVLVLMALPDLHRRLYGKVAEINANDVLQENRKFTIVDLRLEKDYRVSHIENAINIPSTKFEKCKQQVGDLACADNGNKTIVLVCDTDLVSTKLAKKLNDMGSNNIFILKGGFNFWKRKHLPVTHE